MTQSMVQRSWFIAWTKVQGGVPSVHNVVHTEGQEEEKIR